jgi:hypothetical protein
MEIIRREYLVKSEDQQGVHQQKPATDAAIPDSYFGCRQKYRHKKGAQVRHVYFPLYLPIGRARGPLCTDDDGDDRK